MAGDSSGDSRALDQTPTWAVAGVSVIIIIVSISLEKIIHKVGVWFTERHKKALLEALEKVKTELMTLGFISLLLAFGQNYIIGICIPSHLANTMLPCPAASKTNPGEEEEGRRRLLWIQRRILAADRKPSKCDGGKLPLISEEGLHQLHVLIFFLACFHVFYSAATMGLGKLKIRRWKQWEQETSSVDYEFSTDPSRFRLSRETSFVRVHSSFWARIPVFFYVGCFFRQFFRSVHKSDYFTLRNGFINVHLAPGSKFNFQKYIKRALEDDFKVVVGVSPFLWASFVLFLLLTVNKYLIVVWGSIVPLLVILAVGTKLQAILTRMALQITEKHTVVQGIPLVQGNDKYFWFGRPRLVLHCIHFVLFLNTIQIIYSLWILYEFKSCIKEGYKILILKISLGVGVLILCAYSTLPVYALITQMGSHMKMSVFDEQTSKALKKWRLAVKKKRKSGHYERSNTTRDDNGESSTPLKNPTVRSTLRFKTTLNSSRTINYEDPEISDFEEDQRRDDNGESSTPRFSRSNTTRDDNGESSTPLKNPTVRSTLRFKTTLNSSRTINYEDPEISDFEEDPTSPNLVITVDSGMEAVAPESDNAKELSFVKSVP